MAACQAPPKRGTGARFVQDNADPLARGAGGGDVVDAGGAIPDSGPAATHTTIVNITVTDEGFQAPDSLVTGSVEFRVTNKGKFVHEARLVELPPSRTPGDAIGIINSTKHLPVSQGAGGAGPIEPGHTVSVTQLITRPGNYLIVCKMRQSDGSMWFTHGLVRVLVLWGSRAAWRQPPLLVSSGMIITTGTIMRFGAALTRAGQTRSLQLEGRWRIMQIPRGDNLLKLEHRGGLGHSLVIMKTGDPLQMHAFVDWYNGDRGDPPPGIVGGIPGLYGPIMTFYVKLTGLTPGTYTIFCPETHGGTPDFELGEVDQFYVF